MKKVLLFLGILFLVNSVSRAQDCSVNSGVPIEYCPGDSMTLYGNLTGAIGSPVTWQQIAGPTVLIANPNANITPCGIANSGSTYTFVVSATCADNFTSYDTVTYTVKVGPMPNTPPAANAGPPTLNVGCYNVSGANPGFSLSATPAPAGFVGTWTSKYGTFSNINNPNATYYPRIPNYICPDSLELDVLTWTLTDPNYQPQPGCTDNSKKTLDSIVVVGKIYEDIKARVILPGCGNVTENVTLEGSCPAPNGTSMWSLISGPSGYSFTPINTRNHTIVGMPNGTYTFRYKVTGPCYTDSVDKTFIKIGGSQFAVTPANANAAGLPTVICSSMPDTLMLGANLPNVGESGMWTQTSGPNAAIFSDPADPNTLVTGLSNDVYSFRWTITNSVGCSVFSNYQITISNDSIPLPLNIPLTCNGFIRPGSNTNLFASHPVVGTPNAIGPCGTQDLLLIGEHLQLGTWDQIQTPVYETGLPFPWKIKGYYLNAKPDAAPNLLTYFPVGAGAAQNGAWDCSPNGLDVLVRGGYAAFRLKAPFVPGYYAGAIVYENPVCNRTVVDSFDLEYDITTSGANSGTDQNLPCSVFYDMDPITMQPITIISYQTSTNLAGSDPLVTPPFRGFGTWTQISGPNTATMADKHNHSTAISNLVPGKYVFQWSIATSSRCENSDQDYVQINVQGPPPPPSAFDFVHDTVTCYQTPYIISLVSNTNVSMIDIIDGNDFTTAWSVVSPGGSLGALVNFTPINDTAVEVSGLQPSKTYVFRVTISNACGESTFKNVTMQTTGDAGATAVADANAANYSLCKIASTTSLNLSGSVSTSTPGTTQQWSKINASDPGTITNPTATSTSVTGLTPGVYGYVYTISNSICGTSSSDTVFFAISSPISNAVAMNDTSFCVIGDTSSFDLNATAPAAGTGMWELLSYPTDATFDPSMNNTTVNGAKAGEYKFVWKVYDVKTPSGYCQINTDTVVVKIYQAPSTPNILSNDSTICQGVQSVILPITAESPNAGTGVWNVIKGDATISSTTDTSIQVTFNTGESVLQWNVWPNNSVCGTKQSRQIELNIIPDADIADDTLSFCNATSALLKSNQPAPASGSWSLVSQPASSPAVSFKTQLVDTIVSAGPLVGGTYVFRWSVTAPNCGTTFDDVVVQIDTIIEPAAAPDGCGQVGEPIDLAGSTIPANYDATWTLFFKPSGAATGTFANDTTANASYSSPTVPGEYLFAYSFEYGACSKTDYTKVRVVTNSLAGADQIACNGTNYALAADSASAGNSESGVWQILFNNPTLTDSTDYAATATLALGDSAQLSWVITAPYGCTSQDTVNLVSRIGYISNGLVDSSYCDNANGIDLLGSSYTAPAKAAWEVISQPPGSPTYILDSLNPSDANLKNLSIGQYVVSYSIENSPCAVSVYLDTISSICNALNMSLPVSGLEFSVLKNKGNNRLLWSTLSEDNIDNFEILRSFDSTAAFQVIATLKAGMNGGKNYSFTDNDIQDGLTYYRLKLNDKSNIEASYSEVLVVNRLDNQSILLTPNPARNKITLSFSDKVRKMKFIRIMDAQGKIVLSQNTNNEQQIVIDISELANGFYTAVISNTDQKISIPFVKKN